MKHFSTMQLSGQTDLWEMLRDRSFSSAFLPRGVIAALKHGQLVWSSVELFAVK